MIVGTFLGVVFIPLFFVVVQRLFVSGKPAQTSAVPVVGAGSSEQG
jgi:hypothetical protein